MPFKSVLYYFKKIVCISQSLANQNILFKELNGKAQISMTQCSWHIGSVIAVVGVGFSVRINKGHLIILIIDTDTSNLLTIIIYQETIFFL